MKRKLLKLNLTLFEGEGTGGEAAAPQAAAGESRAVVYGVQPEEAQVAAEEPSTKTTSNTLQEREAEFEKLIKGDYKDVFTKRMQKVINERFGETKDLKAQMEATRPILEMLQQRYGADDVTMLARALEEDNAYYEQEAAEKGMTVEQLKEVKRLERENAELLQQQQERQQREEFDQFMNGCLEQSEMLKEIYPNFDFETEMQDNKNFQNLVFKGVDVKTAYEVTHMNDIMGGVAQYTAQQTRKATINNIKARNTRPLEGGAAKQSGVTVKRDVHNLTRHDRAEIARRVARGETIRF